MGLFSHFKEQEERLDALENHVRYMTEAVQQNQIDIAGGLVALFAIQAQLDEKVSASEVDPAIGELNAQIGVARKKYHAASEAAAESWVTMQEGVADSLASLRSAAESARRRLTEAKAELQ